MEHFVLISYISRSGSTFLVNQLSKHKDIVVAPEAEVLVNELLLKRGSRDPINRIMQDRKFRAWKPECNIRDLAGNTDKPEDLFFEILKKYRDSFSPGSGIIVFKAHELFRYLEVLDTKSLQKYRISFISLVRDPRAVVHSQFSTLYLGKPMENNSVRVSLKWKEFLLASTEHREKLALLKYEEMILHPVPFFRELFERLSLDWNEGILAKSGKVGSILPAEQRELHPHIDEPAEPGFINSWKNGLKVQDIRIVQFFCKQQMKELEYSLMETKDQSLRTIMKLILDLAGYYFFR